MKKNKKVMVFGAFDILHLGHINFLEQAKNYGDYLIVAVARDKNIKKIKGVWPKLDERARKKLIGLLRIVDQAIYGDKANWYRVILEYKPDIICLGYDQKTPNDFLEELKKRKVTAEIIRLRPYKPKKYKSSIILNS